MGGKSSAGHEGLSPQLEHLASYLNLASYLTGTAQPPQLKGMA